MGKVRIGLIGLGFMGTTHYGIYRNLPDAEVVAVADVDPAKRAGDISAVAGNIGAGAGSRLDLAGVAVYEDGFRMIAEAAVDVVDICVPTPFHKDYIVAALAAGRHVFSEKPLCRDREQAAEIIAAVKRSDRFFNVGMCVRAWPEYVHARELITSGAIGEVRSAVFRRLSPSVDGNAWENWFMKDELSGGALLDMHMHDTDIVRHFFGRPRRVSSFGVRGMVSDNAIDHVVTDYDFEDGRLISAEGNWGLARGVPFEMSFRIVAEKATVIMDPAGYKVYWTDGKVETPEVVDPALPTGWHQELNYFVNCVRDGVRPDRYQTLESVADGFQIAMAEIESVDRREAVEVNYV